VLLKTVSFWVRSTLLCSAHRTHKRGHAETRGWPSQTEERNNRRWCRQYVRNFEFCSWDVLPRFCRSTLGRPRLKCYTWFFVLDNACL